MLGKELAQLGVHDGADVAEELRAESEQLCGRGRVAGGCLYQKPGDGG